MDSSTPSKTTIYAALAGDTMVAVTKLSAAIWAGSSSMLGEGVHSIVDTGNEICCSTAIAAPSVRPTRAFRRAKGGAG